MYVTSAPHVTPHVPAMANMRSLLGGSDEALVHDPGAEGPEGEGEAAMTMMVLVYAVALGLIIYGTSRCPANQPHGFCPTVPPHAPPHLERRSPHARRTPLHAVTRWVETARGTPRTRVRRRARRHRTKKKKKKLAAFPFLRDWMPCMPCPQNWVPCPQAHAF